MKSKRLSRSRIASCFEDGMPATQCFLLKSLKDPAGTGGLTGGGLVCDQMYCDSPRSMGASVMASIYSTTKARKNIRSIPTDIKTASTIRGMMVVLLDRTLSVADNLSGLSILQFKK
jgi:hypothetical protein